MFANENHAHKSVALLAAGLLIFTLFQFWQVLGDRSQLAKAKEAMETRIAEADKVLAENQKMLDQLNAIAIGTQRLSEAGNPNAKEIVNQLNKLGIKINPNFKEDQEKAAASQAGGEAPAAPAPGAPAAPAAPAPATP